MVYQVPLKRVWLKNNAKGFSSLNTYSPICKCTICFMFYVKLTIAINLMNFKTWTISWSSYNAHSVSICHIGDAFRWDRDTKL